jgi:hypothetical protein
MNTVDVGSLGAAPVSGRCPQCHATNIRWFGILRVCTACAYTFHWREILPET